LDVLNAQVFRAGTSGEIPNRARYSQEITRARA
jgi:hypothetical protein